jgi:hypothetical protein
MSRWRARYWLTASRKAQSLQLELTLGFAMAASHSEARVRKLKAQSSRLSAQELTVEFAMPARAPRSPNAAVRRSGDLANAEEASTCTTHLSRTWRRSDCAIRPSSTTNGRSVARMAARRPRIETTRTADSTMQHHRAGEATARGDEAHPCNEDPTATRHASLRLMSRSCTALHRIVPRVAPR